MCGIAGYIGREKIDSLRINKCLSIMGRRGPDHSEYYYHQYRPDQNVYLLHSRLSIIDLDARSNQPFRRGTKVLVNNGELYNYLEIKNDLKSQGQDFSTTSDTEVLLAVISQFGWKNALDRCEGMWAFALYDEKDGSLLLSRDRFGEKPLYVYKNSGGAYFGSEPKFIFALLGKRLEINLNHLYRYVLHGYRALYKTEEQYFQGLSEVNHGSVLEIRPDRIPEKKKYWDVNYQIDESISYQHALEGVRERLIQSVKLRLRADVPLAFCMSGGVDSNSLISIAKRVFNYDVHGFTIMNKDARYEEKDMVEYAVKELGIRHTEIPVNTSNFIPKLKTLINYHDSPVSTISYYAHYLLMESISSHGYRISVSGSAGDELFSGYYDHFLAYLKEVKNDKNLFQESLDNWLKYIKPLIRNPNLKNESLFINNNEFRDHIYMDGDDFSSYFIDKWSEPFIENSYSGSLLRNRMLNEIFVESIPVVLHEDDLNAMYYSIENRSPFLDRNLFEYANKIPTKYLIKDGYAKALLRDAMSGIVPDQVIKSRKKVGFNAPIFSFLDVRDKKVKEYLLDDSFIYEHVVKKKIEDMLHKDDLINSESKLLFSFLCAKIFLEEFH